MDEKNITTRAEEYIRLETDLFFKNQVIDLLGKRKFDELGDRFYTGLEFGTGGLRGIIGGGFNRMNPFIVRQATQGLADYILHNPDVNKEQGKSTERKASAVIAFDSRNFSKLFALKSAEVFAGNGIIVYLFSSLHPTPLLSFAVRYLKATCGIVITASHNPKEYNGYKVFWNDGAQIVSPHDTGIIAAVGRVNGNIRSIPEKEAKSRGLLKIIGREVDDAYFRMVEKLCFRRETAKKEGKKLKVVYTPLFGSGALPVKRALHEMGIEIIPVKDQFRPDGNFPGLAYPNPEESSALEKAILLAKKKNADMVIGTDPDSDRLGIAVKDKNGFTLITGNQLGVLLADYILFSMNELKRLPRKPAIVKTIVTSELGRLVAENYGAACFDTLTGFKHICGKINDFEKEENGNTFIFGYEESYGYLAGVEVRDKDAVSASALTCEMALYYRVLGKSIISRLNELYHQYGYFEEVLISRHFKGESGLHAMKNFMDKLRNQPPGSFAGQKLHIIKDYMTQEIHYPETRKKEKITGLPVSNVLQYILSDKSIVSVRPSGTEPKIKFYASCRTEPGEEPEKAKALVKEKIMLIDKEITGLIESI